MNRKIQMFAVLAAMLFAVTTVHAAGDNPRREWFKDRMEARQDMIHEWLDLTPEQKEQLAEHREAHREEMKALWEEMKKHRDELAAEIQKPALDMAQVRRIHARLKAVKSSVEDQRLQSILDVREILTPEQFTKFIEFKEQHKGAFGGPWKKKGSQ